MPNPTVIICVDGLDPDYLDACEMPVLKGLAAGGIFKQGRSMMPSVTNVNNVSLVTASYPESHGICSNYWVEQESGEGTYMESNSFVLIETMFQRATAQRKNSILVTSKDKLRTLLGDATITVSSERPPGWVVDAMGPPPEIYSLEVNAWVIRAGSFVMERRPWDIAYITTTDYAMHTYAPDEPQSARHLAMLDEAIGELVQAHPAATLLLTADHGMNSKSRLVDLKDELARRGIESRPEPVIKDRYVVHHQNLGGCMFVYLDTRDVAEAVKVLRETRGVEEALPREEAAQLLRLNAERIADIVVTGAADVVFGDASEVDRPAGLRSHGSHHERAVPIIGHNGDFRDFLFQENRDVGRYVFEKVLC